MAFAYEPIYAVYTQAAGTSFPAMSRYPEAASKTFKQGVPLVLSAGFLQEAAFGGAEIVFGVSAEPAHNLATSGVEEGGTSEGTAQNMPSSRIIPVGAWMKDGNVGVYKADGTTVFSISLKTGQTYSDALIAASTAYGLTRDATSGYWYLDTADTAGDNAVARIVSGDSRDNTKVFFQFIPALRYFG